MDFTILYPIGAVVAMDTITWFNWAWKDNHFEQWEVKILVGRLLKYGGLAGLMLFAGMSKEVAIVVAGLGPVVEDFKNS